ncbi:MAG: DUF4440 domain-containing protein [Burkholderiaceae bacterium]|nr:DUF4440 domain-containing protein [Burkholderiaceae bacterium]
MRLLITSVAVVLLAGCATPSSNQTASTCYRASSQEIADQFGLWNAALQTGQPQTVVARYSSDSVLLPTLSNTVRVTADAKVDYFKHFLEKHPVGTIDQRHIIIECNAAIDTGLYTFAFNDGSTAKARYTFTYRRDGKNWLITSHHSSLMPEAQ